MIADLEVTCFYCHRGPYGHNDLTGECRVFERSIYKPFEYRARPQAAAKGWRVR